MKIEDNHNPSTQEREDDNNALMAVIEAENKDVCDNCEVNICQACIGESPLRTYEIKGRA